MVLNGDTDGDLRAVRGPGDDSPGTAAGAPPIDESRWAELARTPSHELGALTRRAIDTLSHRADEAAFAELLALSESLGVAVGASARTLAANGSWSRVAEVAGLSRQSAWARWRD